MADEQECMVDDELRRQLEHAGADHSIGAVFTLRGTDAQEFLSPAQARSLAERVVERAANDAHARPEALQVFANVQSFAVQGPATLVRAILAQPEVETAVANVQPEDMLIRPVERHDVELEGGARRGKKKKG